MSWLTNPASRVRAVGVGLLLLTFGVGGLAGAAARQVVVAREPATVGMPADGTCDGRNERRRLGVYEDLDITTEQRADIERIMADRRNQIDALLEVHEPRMKAIIDSTNAEIHSLLTPAQLEELAERRAEWRARRQQAERENDQRDQRDRGGR
jgi:Spy/CpxP family protein refolding chaperone